MIRIRWHTAAGHRTQVSQKSTGAGVHVRSPWGGLEAPPAHAGAGAGWGRVPMGRNAVRLPRRHAESPFFARDGFSVSPHWHLSGRERAISPATEPAAATSPSGRLHHTIRGSNTRPGPSACARTGHSRAGRTSGCQTVKIPAGVWCKPGGDTRRHRVPGHERGGSGLVPYRNPGACGTARRAPPLPLASGRSTSQCWHHVHHLMVIEGAGHQAPTHPAHQR